LTTIVIDPDPNAYSKAIATAFEVVKADDYEGTCRVVDKYNIQAIITTATDKPLLMMARIAAKYDFPFFSEETAIVSTDKYLMKERFIRSRIPCAKGALIDKPTINFEYPLIIKPRDNSGSRGVLLCNNKADLENAFHEAIECTQKKTLLIEEFIDGKEYSIEALHFNGKSQVIQITEKLITEAPYNVELGHIQPADLTETAEDVIASIIQRIADALGFIHCASHTELKTGSKGTFIIETSPRMGGDYITSVLVPLSTGINIENAAIDIAYGIKPELPTSEKRASMIRYLQLSQGIVRKINPSVGLSDGIIYCCNLKPGSVIPRIASSLDRYGYIIASGANRNEVLTKMNTIYNRILETFTIE